MQYSLLVQDTYNIVVGSIIAENCLKIHREVQSTVIVYFLLVTFHRFHQNFEGKNSRQAIFIAVPLAPFSLYLYWL